LFALREGEVSRAQGQRVAEGFLMRVLILGSAIALLIALVTATSSAGEASGGKKQLSQDQAGTVVLTFLKSQGYKTESPKFDLESDPDDPDFPEFYMFHAYYDTATRLNSIGAYAVNRKTTALWERVGCEQLKSKALEQLQHKLRREMGLSEAHGVGSRAKPCF
jgi:hypothetical protein